MTEQKSKPGQEEKSQGSEPSFEDMPPPTWWVALFNFTVLFAIGYMVWFHGLGKPGLQEQLSQDQKLHQQLMAARQQQGLDTGAAPEDLKLVLREPKRIAEGVELYATHCASCHGQAGEGTVGPNLTDRFWIHGGLPEQVVETIQNGVPSMGMVAWGGILGQDKVKSVTAYVFSLQGTQPANAKAPQGDEYEPALK